MLQKYIVFLNNRRIEITGKKDFLLTDNQVFVINYVSKAQLYNAFQHFKNNEDIACFIVIVDKYFKKVCKEFNSYFKIVHAAGGIVRNSQHQILWIRRWNLWDLPKGKLQKNEESDMGALREVMEETGLSDLSLSRELIKTHHIYYIHDKPILKQTVWFEMHSSKEQILKPQLEEDITEAVWVNKSDISPMLDNTYASIRLLMDYYLHE